MEKFETALELFQHMKKSLLIDVNNVDFLLECLGHIRRFDLIKKLGFDMDLVKSALPSLNKISRFRYECSYIFNVDTPHFAKLKLYD